jgi:hypothetical protein
MQGPPVRGVFSSYLSGPDPPDYAPAPWRSSNKLELLLKIQQKSRKCA